MSLLFLKRSATTNSTSVINHNSSSTSNSNNNNHQNGHCKTNSNASVSVQNLVSLTTRLNHRYSFLTTPDLTADLTQSANDLNNSHSKREREKLNVLKEVISSEKKYLNDLKEIVDGYYDEIAKFKDTDFMHHIFSNIREIYEFTKGFYLMLEGSNLDEIAIATCFIKMHRNFSLLYSTYCQNYKIAYITSEKLEKDPNIGKIIEKVRIKYGHHLKMATYLQLPVLRITKYHLLLQRYLKLLDEDSFAYTQILEALDLMRQVNDQINKEMSSDLDKPFDDDLFETSAASNLNMLKLVGLFGSVLKQGNLILNETKTYHHVIVFQNMLLIRKSDLYLSKVICTISNENLGFSPISNSKHCNKSFTVIDYSQKKSSENSEYCQFTLKTRSVEEKKAWQACILQCILNGYGKKLPDNVKKRVLKIDNPKVTSKYETIRMKLSSFKRIKDLRHTIRYDLKRSNSQELKSKQQLIETTNAHTTNQTNSRRRLSEHFQSSIKKLLDKKPDNKTDSLLKSFRRDKISNRLFSNQKFKSNCSILNESTSNETKAQENSPIEIKLDYDQASHLMNTSYMSVYSSFEKIDQSAILKFESILNENNKKINEFDFCYCDSNDSFSSTSKDIILKQTEEIISSNSEEGYYSNHDSSSTVSTLINEQLMDLDEPPSKQAELSNCKFHIPVDYSRFSYNCYSNENNTNTISNDVDSQQTLTMLPQDLNESQVRLTRNKFSSLSSLKQELASKQASFNSINKSNSYVSEIKLFFDSHHTLLPLTSQNSREDKLNMSSESDVDFKINIKDLISKFEKNK